MPIFERTSRMPVSARTLYEWHSRRGAFERLVPPWDDVREVEGREPVHEGLVKVLEIRQAGVTTTWKALHTDVVPGEQFVDRQIQGPFASWVHTHRFEALSPGESLLRDHIEYALPLGAPAQAIAGPLAERMLDRMFAFRHRRTREDLMRHERYSDAAPLRVAVTGSHGLIGDALCALLTTGGHRVHRVVRRRDQLGDDAIYWNPSDHEIDASGFEGVDAVVHLAGESLFGLRWTEEKKRKIHDSRVEGTRLLAEALAGLDTPPKTLVSSSAVGYYGDRGDEKLSEGARSGEGFLAEVCQAWEAAAEPARAAGIRVVHPRTAVVLSRKGGALETMETPFKLGMGGRIGSGQQYFSWIHLDDAIGAILHMLHTPTLQGPVNLTAPDPVTNAEFTKALGKALHRPTFIPVPASAIRLAMGEAGEEMLLVSQRALPSKLLEADFDFLHADVESALQAEFS